MTARRAVMDGASQAATLVASGFTQPLFLTAPVGDSRLFVVEKAGTIILVDHGVPLTDEDAHDVVRSLRGSPLLFGYRGAPAVADVVVPRLIPGIPAAE